MATRVFTLNKIEDLLLATQDASVLVLQEVATDPPVPIEPGGDDDLLAALKAMHADLIKLGCHLGAWQG